MSMNKGSLNQEKLNLDSLFELLNHNETNYAFFAVSRIKVISKIIGPCRTAGELIPELRKFVSKTLLYQEISELILQAINEMEGKEPQKKL